MKLRHSFVSAEQDFSSPQFARMSEATRLVALEQLARLESKQKRSKENRRASQRVEIRGEAELVAVEQHQMPGSVSVQLRDVSWTGVGFICSVPLPENSHWRICFVKDGVQVARRK